MKFVTAVAAVAAFSLLAVPAFAGAAPARKANGNRCICQYATDTGTACPLLAGRGKGNGAGKGKGRGLGDGTGNGGNGPKDGTGPRSQNGTCINS